MEERLPVPLRELLTSLPTPKREPLFRSGLELGRLISETETYEVSEDGVSKTYKNPYAGRQQTSIGMINQLMRSECVASADLLRIIKYLVSQKLHGIDQKQIDTWIVKVEESIKQIVVERKGNEFYKEVLEIGIERAGRAKDLFFLYSSVSPFASDFFELKSVMTPLLALTPEIKSPSARFSFYYAENANLYEIWKRIFMDAVGINPAIDYCPLSFNPEKQDIDYEYGIKRAVEVLEKLESSGLLQTFLVPEYIVSVPMVALDPLSNEPVAFVGFSSPDEPIKAMPVPEPYLTRWINKVVKPLLNGEVSVTKRCSFAEVRDRIVDEARLATTLGMNLPDYTSSVEQFRARMEHLSFSNT